MSMDESFVKHPDNVSSVSWVGRHPKLFKEEKLMKEASVMDAAISA